MHLAIEAVGTRSGGGATVLLDFLSAVLGCPAVERITVFASHASARRFAYPHHGKLHVRELSFADRSKAARMVWLHAGLRRAVSQIRAEALLCFNSVGIGGVPQLSFVQQSLPFCSEALALYPALTRLYVAALAGVMRAAARRSHAVFVQTGTMAKWVARDFGIPASRIVVVPPAAPPIDAVRHPLCPAAMSQGIPRRLLYVGSASRSKNLPTLLRGAAILRERDAGLGLFATCTAAELGGAEGVYALGYLSSELLAGAYQAAAMLIMPSLVETVGFPMLEAMAMGVPVLAADRPYAHEVCGPAAHYFDPTDPAHLAREAVRILESRQLRDELAAAGRERVRRGRHAKPWEPLLNMLGSSTATMLGVPAGPVIHSPSE
jgi:glycosyltransferase involved in cell wall biosynthesis